MEFWIETGGTHYLRYTEHSKTGPGWFLIRSKTINESFWSCDISWMMRTCDVNGSMFCIFICHWCDIGTLPLSERESEGEMMWDAKSQKHSGEKSGWQSKWLNCRSETHWQTMISYYLIKGSMVWASNKTNPIFLGWCLRPTQLQHPLLHWQQFLSMRGG